MQYIRISIKKLISVMIVMCLVMLPCTPSDAKMVKEYLGKWYVSSYHASDNTPRNSHATASGKRATVGRTVAVDIKNPLVPMGTKIKIQGLGKRTVEDRGGFGRYNGGRRKFDVFMPEGKGFLKVLKVWKYRKETKAEKKKRLKKLRKKRQKKTFKLKFDTKLADNVMITDGRWIKKGTVRIGSLYFEVKKNKKGLKNTILIGDEDADGIKTKLSEVIEGAKG